MTDKGKAREQEDQEESPNRNVRDEQAASGNPQAQEGEYRPKYWGQRRNVPDHEHNEYGWSEYYGEPGAREEQDEREDSQRERWRMSGQFTGKGPRGYTRRDEKILDEIVDRLTQHGQIDATDIEVDVTNGTVILSGTVSTRNEKYLAEDTAETVSGVVEMINRLHVDPDRR